MLTKLVSLKSCDEQSNAKHGGMGYRDECWLEAESVREQDRSRIEVTTTGIVQKASSFAFKEPPNCMELSNICIDPIEKIKVSICGRELALRRRAKLAPPPPNSFRRCASEG